MENTRNVNPCDSGRIGRMEISQSTSGLEKEERSQNVHKSKHYNLGMVRDVCETSTLSSGCLNQGSRADDLTLDMGDSIELLFSPPPEP